MNKGLGARETAVAAGPLTISHLLIIGCAFCRNRFLLSL